MNLTYFLVWSGTHISYSILFRYRAYNAERVPTSGPVILAANHASMIDPPLVGVGLYRQVSYLARESLFRFPVFGTILRNVNAVPVDRDGGGAAGLRTILERLLAGEGIVLFPEGTRTPDGRIQKARSGIGLTVIKSEAPVVPVRLFGTYEAWGRHRTLPRFHPVIVKYGRPIDFSALRAEAKTCSKARLKEIYPQVADQIMATIARLQPCEDKERFP